MSSKKLVVDSQYTASENTDKIQQLREARIQKFAEEFAKVEIVPDAEELPENTDVESVTGQHLKDSHNELRSILAAAQTELDKAR
jgi:hypothetical protein